MTAPQGLYYNPGFYPTGLSPQAGSKRLPLDIKELDKMPWSDALNRRTQQYGARYDYKSRKLVYDVEPLSVCPMLDKVAKELNPRLQSVTGDSKLVFDKCIVNEYLAKQRITAHTDSPIFGPVVMTVSLGSSATMLMTLAKHEPYRIVLNHGDLVTLTGEARTRWKHEILPGSGKDFRRVSLTFRT
jgi:alkylated DNA repair protein (DNA oxidative demethylase)